MVVRLWGNVGAEEECGKIALFIFYMQVLDERIRISFGELMWNKHVRCVFFIIILHEIYLILLFTDTLNMRILGNI